MRIIVLIKPGAELEESDACAVEQALRVARRRLDIQVSVLTAGPSACVRALRAALALGADDAVHVSDPRISPHDALTLSRVLAASILELGYDLVLCGAASDAPNLTMVPAMVAARLGIPAHCHTLRLDEDMIELPALISVAPRSSPPRHPPFPAVAEARQKLISTRTPKSITPQQDPLITVKSLPSQPNMIIKAEADPRAAAAHLADFLAERRFI